MKYLIIAIVCLIGRSGYSVFALPKATIPYQGANSSTSAQDELKEAALHVDSPIQRLIKVFLPNRPAGEGVVAYIQYIINVALGLVAFIAVLVLVYGFYGILFGKSEEGISRAKKIVKGTFVAIITMGASWIIVRLMFYLITRFQ